MLKSKDKQNRDSLKKRKMKMKKSRSMIATKNMYFLKKLRKYFKWKEQYATVSKNSEKAIFEAPLKQSNFKVLGEITEVFLLLKNLLRLVLSELH